MNGMSFFSNTGRDIDVDKNIQNALKRLSQDPRSILPLHDLNPLYGSREEIAVQIKSGAIPDPFFKRVEVIDDLTERKKRGEPLPAERQQYPLNPDETD